VAAGLKCYECFHSDCNDESKFKETSCDEDSGLLCFSAYACNTASIYMLHFSWIDFFTDNDEYDLFIKNCDEEKSMKSLCDYVINVMDGDCYTCSEDFCNKNNNNTCTSLCYWFKILKINCIIYEYRYTGLLDCTLYRPILSKQ
jgi:hypothetical protein